jgi:transcriptional regulator with XRE-family HTH domain
MMVGSGSIPKVSTRQIKAARALLAWSQDDLAARSGVSTPTIKRLEAADGLFGGSLQTGQKILSALRTAGVNFIDENGGGEGVRLRNPRRSFDGKGVDRRPKRD